MDKLLNEEMKTKIEKAIGLSEYRTTQGRQFTYSEKKPEYIEVVVFEEGTLYHPMWGEEHITVDRLQRFKDNFDMNVRKTEIFLDEDHEPNHRKRGTFEELFFKTSDEGKTQLWARIHLAPVGQELVKNDEYNYFSPEWYDEWTDPQENTYKDVLIGGALTNRPFQNHLPKALVFSENFISNHHNMNQDDVKNPQDEETTEETVETKPVETTEEEKETVTDETTETEVVAEDATEEVVEEVVEESTETVEEEATEEEETKEFSEKMFSELPPKARKYIEKLQEENKKFSEEEESRKLTEYVSAFVYSESNKEGKFLQKSESKLVEFASTLTENQRKMFSEIMGDVKAFSIGKVGATVTPKEYESASDEVSRLEAKYMSEKGISYQSAKELVRKEHPDLIKEYAEEVKNLLQKN
jgi:hypothetical protein